MKDKLEVALPRYRAIGFDAETNSAEMVDDPEGAWVHILDLQHTNPERSGVVSDACARADKAEKWAAVLEEAMRSILTIGECVEVNDYADDDIMREWPEGMV